MLVLTRKPDEKIVFPSLGISVQLLGLKGNVARIGVDAPPHIRVLRSELAGKAEFAPAPPEPSSHAMANRLSKISLSLHVVERLWSAGRTEEARKTLDGVLSNLDSMDREWVFDHLPGDGQSAPAPKHCRTLVVDDDTNERELLAGILHMNGCECATARDGEDALTYLANHDRPDFLLLDMWMPRCDGPSTLRSIRSNPRYAGLKVFAISGSPPEEVGVGTGPNGIDAWFPKPLNPRKLWDAIRDNMVAAN